MPVHIPDLLTRLRVGLRLRQRLRPAAEVKGDEELAWWLQTWNPALAGDDFVAGDVLELLDAERVRSWLRPMALVYEDSWTHPHGHDGHAVVLVATQP